jgi:hypothetical protein
MKILQAIVTISIIILMCLAFSWWVHSVSVVFEKAGNEISTELKQRGLKNILKEELGPYWNGTDSIESE